MFKKVLLSVAVIMAFGIYAVRQQILGTHIQPLSATGNIVTTNDVADLPTSLLQTQETLVPTPISTPAGQYKDGQYTGSVANAFYGPLQVKAIIQGGKLVDVQFLQYPNDRNTSIEINSQAMPYLRTEALQVQSAQVSGVTGASASSGAFIESLGSALSQAHP